MPAKRKPAQRLGRERAEAPRSGDAPARDCRQCSVSPFTNALTDAFARGKAAGAAEERAAVVGWLRRHAWGICADGITEGDHLAP